MSHPPPRPHTPPAVGDEEGTSDDSDTRFVCDALGLDIGGSLTKLVYFEPFEGGTPERRKLFEFMKEREDAHMAFEDTKLGGHLRFMRFETRFMGRFVAYLQEHKTWDEITIHVTGGGAYKYANELRDLGAIRAEKVDEMEALITGLNYLLVNVPNEAFSYSLAPPGSPKKYSRDFKKEVMFGDADFPFPYLLVNIGSGVSILKIDDGKYQRVSGSSLGGGTFWGLCRLLTDFRNFDEALEKTLRGVNSSVDMLVGDIYGRNYDMIGLDKDVIASSFGKCISRENPREGVGDEDVALSLLRMVTYNISQIAYLNAVRYNVKNIVYSGFFIRDHPITMHALSLTLSFWSQGTIKALFLAHEGYPGAVGAALHDWGLQRRRSSISGDPLPRLRPLLFYRRFSHPIEEDLPPSDGPH